MKKYIALGMLLMFLSTPVVLAANNLSDLSKQKSQIEKELGNVKGQKSDAQEEVKKLESQITQEEQSLNEIDGEINNLDDTIGELETELSQLDEEYIKQKDILDKRVIALYESGQTSYMEVLLTSKDISEFLSKYYLVNEIAENDKKMLNDMQELKNSINMRKEDLNKQLEAREVAKNNKTIKVENLNNNKNAKNKLVSELSQKEQDLIKEQKKIDDEYKRLQQEANKKSSNSSTSKYTGGTMQWPVPSSSTITSAFGPRIHPITGRQSMHTGIDIGAKSGTDIVAANDGVVIQRGLSSSWGNYIAVDHGGGIVTFYAHASSLVAANGKTVKRGEVIAKVGSTGVSTGPHLHFEVRKNGTSVNPLNGYLAK